MQNLINTQIGYVMPFIAAIFAKTSTIAAWVTKNTFEDTQDYDIAYR